MYFRCKTLSSLLRHAHSLTRDSLDQQHHSTLTLTHSRSHMLTLALSPAHTLSHAHPLTCTRHSLACSLACAHSLAHVHSLTQSRTLSREIVWINSTTALSHTLHSLTLTRCTSLTLSRSLSHSFSSIITGVAARSDLASFHHWSTHTCGPQMSRRWGHA